MLSILETKPPNFNPYVPALPIKLSHSEHLVSLFASAKSSSQSLISIFFRLFFHQIRTFWKQKTSQVFKKPNHRAEWSMQLIVTDFFVLLPQPNLDFNSGQPNCNWDHSSEGIDKSRLSFSSAKTLSQYLQVISVSSVLPFSRFEKLLLFLQKTIIQKKTSENRN